MANKPTEKSKFPSRYSHSKFVTASQYITELICEKKARKESKDLPLNFWNQPEWESFYKQQVWSACNLLKKFSPTAIIRALNSKEAYSTYSLRAPHLLPLIQKEQDKFDIESDIEFTPISRIDTESKPRIHNIKKGILDKLDE